MPTKNQPLRSPPPDALARIPRSVEGVTPLIMATELKQRPLIRVLLERGADPNRINRKGYSAPMIQACKNDKNVLVSCPKRAPRHAKRACAAHRTRQGDFISAAAPAKQLDLESRYKEPASGPSLGRSPTDNPPTGSTLLCMAAVWRDNYEVVLALLDAGADLRAAADNKAQTALAIARENGNEEIVQLLEKRAEKQCAHCGASRASSLLCSACKLLSYCNDECARAHWPEHKSNAVCKAARKAAKEAQK